MKDTMGIDQYGTTFHGLGKHPRKTLLERLDATHAEKMYIDREENTYHIGYIIEDLWITIYNITEWEKPA